MSKMNSIGLHSQKKLQSTLKSLVQLMGSLIKNWIEHDQEILKLLQYLETLESSIQSVKLTWNKVNDLDCFQISSKTINKYLLDVCPRIISQMRSDAESIYQQLRKFS